MTSQTRNAETAATAVAADPDAKALHANQDAPRKMTTGERDLAVRLASASVADAIGLYMRSDRHKHQSIADLEWMLMPPLMLGQIKFAYARPQMKQAKDADTGNDEKLPPVAVAMVTWAMVSPEVAAKLDAQKKAGQPFRLAPQEWRSGRERRIVDGIGEKELISELTKRLDVR